MHGGALMALADMAGAICAFLNLPEGATGRRRIESKTKLPPRRPRRPGRRRVAPAPRGPDDDRGRHGASSARTAACGREDDADAGVLR
jgi:acyl-coenzyme A thioesterase PaaI-like protein